MIYLILLVEFFIIGSFAVGGGLATLPFLVNLSQRYPWFDQATLIDMIAISESTPGPIGINMATYAGFKAAGVFGGVIASFAVLTTGLILTIVIAKMLSAFKQNPYVLKVFYGIRPTIAALIAFAAYQMVVVTIFNGSIGYNINLKALGLLLFMIGLNHLSKWHPIVYISIAATLGLIINFG